MYKKCRAKHEEQTKITDQLLQPMHDKISEIEELIRLKKSKINNIKSQIVRNDFMIQNLLSGVVGQ